MCIRDSWYTYGEERLGQGREAAKQTLKENPDLREELENKVREAYEIPVICLLYTSRCV